MVTVGPSHSASPFFLRDGERLVQESLEDQMSLRFDFQQRDRGDGRAAFWGFCHLWDVTIKNIINTDRMRMAPCRGRYLSDAAVDTDTHEKNAAVITNDAIYVTVTALTFRWSCPRFSRTSNCF